MKKKPVFKFKRMAAFIKAERAKSGLGQIPFAKHIGLGDVTYISNIERGICGIPAKHIGDVSNSLKLDPAYIIAIMMADHQDYIYGMVASAQSKKWFTPVNLALDTSTLTNLD